MNFPINYTIQVHYEEVFRLRNISRLVSLYPTDTVPNQPTDSLKDTLHNFPHKLAHFSCLSPIARYLRLVTYNRVSLELQFYGFSGPVTQHLQKIQG